MSQNTDTSTRRKAAELWSKLLMDNAVQGHQQGKLTKVLQDLAEEFDKRVAPIWDSNNHSIAWRDYFAAALLNKVLRELPPKDRSIEDLRTEIERMKSPVEAAAPSNANATDDNTPTASKPVDTTTTDTTFKVDTQGDYKARIVEDGTTKTFEFLLNGPAVVQVQVKTSGAVAAARTPATSANVPADGPNGTGNKASW